MTRATAVLFGMRSPEDLASEMHSQDLVEGKVEVLRGLTPNVATLLFFNKGRPSQKRLLWVVNGTPGGSAWPNADRTLVVGASTRGVLDILETLTTTVGGYLCRRDDRPEWQALGAKPPADADGKAVRPEALDGIVAELAEAIRGPGFIDDWRAAAAACAPAP